MNAGSLDVETSLEITARKRWQLNRDLVITLSHNHGATAEILADVFDLDPSRIKQILRKTKDRYAPRTDQSGSDKSPGPRRFVA